MVHASGSGRDGFIPYFAGSHGVGLLEVGQFDAECRPAGLAGWLSEVQARGVAVSPLRVVLKDQAS